MSTRASSDLLIQLHSVLVVSRAICFLLCACASNMDIWSTVKLRMNKKKFRACNKRKETWIHVHFDIRNLYVYFCVHCNNHFPCFFFVISFFFSFIIAVVTYQNIIAIAMLRSLYASTVSNSHSAHCNINIHKICVIYSRTFSVDCVCYSFHEQRVCAAADLCVRF